MNNGPLGHQPTPLIPISLQLEYDLPNSSVAREFDYAKRMTKSYLLSAQQVKLSYPSIIDDIDVSVSPVFLLIAKQFQWIFPDIATRPYCESQRWPFA